MSTGATAALIVAVIVIVLLLAAVVLATRRRRLQQRFGPEYDRAVAERNSRLRAEAELTDRQRRVRKFHLKPLTEAATSQYNTDWMTVQERFVDSPESAVADAHALVIAVMQGRGYPSVDDEQAMADLSVEHARTVAHFREAQQISKNAATGDVTTEDMRQALIHYRALFSDLLGEPGKVTVPNAADNGVVVGSPAQDEAAASQR
jgi:septation ring formation regulator EzrA